MSDSLDRADVELLEKQTPYRGYFQVDSFHLRHRKFAGGWTDPLTRELFERGNAAAILLYDPAQDAVVLIEQFRIGAYAAGRNPWLIEVVAGIVETGETPEAVVRREAQEEAGCEVQAMSFIGDIILSPGGCSEILHLFCGQVESTNAGGLHGLEHEGEDIRALRLPREVALDRVSKGEIANASTVMALQWLALNHQSLKSAWLKL